MIKANYTPVVLANARTTEVTKVRVKLDMNMIDEMRLAIENYTRASFAADDAWIVPGPNPDAEAILREIVKGDPPIELMQFYGVCNGVGYLAEKDGEEIRWHIPRIENLSSLVEMARGWFSDTHPTLAMRFLAFLNLDGDFCGYLRNSKGAWQKSIHCFEHEEYEFVEKQAADEFVIDLEETLKEYLTNIGLN